MTMRVLIVDDEPLARERLRTLLARETGIEVGGEAGSGPDAVEAIRRLKPDLVLLDIQMPGLDGFGVLRELGPELPAVIFVTAFDGYAVQAFEVHALDYLLKPFKPARLREALSRARARLAGPAPGDVQARVLALLEQHQRRQQEPAWLARLAVRTGDRVRFIRTEDIDWIEASGNYVVVHAGAERHTLRETLGSLEARLSPACFQRLSRSAVANIDRIREIQPLARGEPVAILHGGARITMTRGLRELQERLKFG